MVLQMVRDSFLTLEFAPIPFWLPEFSVTSVADSAFMNALEDEEALEDGELPMALECQQGFHILVGIDDTENGVISPCNVVLFRTHKGRRKYRSTLGAETGAMSEGVNAAEMVRGCFAEVRLGRALVLRPAGYPAKTYEEDIRTVPMTAVTDCRSLYDCLTGVGKRPSEARLALDIGALKEFQELTFRWTRTAQMIADPLTKASAPIFYMVWTFWRHEFYYRHDEQLDRKLAYVKGAMQQLRLEQWRERQAMRHGADQAGYATLSIQDEEQAERRSLMYTTAHRYG